MDVSRHNESSILQVVPQERVVESPNLREDIHPLFHLACLWSYYVHRLPLTPRKNHKTLGYKVQTQTEVHGILVQ